MSTSQEGKREVKNISKSLEEETPNFDHLKRPYPFQGEELKKSEKPRIRLKRMLSLAPDEETDQIDKIIEEKTQDSSQKRESEKKVYQLERTKRRPKSAPLNSIPAGNNSLFLASLLPLPPRLTIDRSSSDAETRLKSLERGLAEEIVQGNRVNLVLHRLRKSLFQAVDRLNQNRTEDCEMLDNLVSIHRGSSNLSPRPVEEHQEDIKELQRKYDREQESIKHTKPRVVLINEREFVRTSRLKSLYSKLEDQQAHFATMMADYREICNLKNSSTLESERQKDIISKAAKDLQKMKDLIKNWESMQTKSRFASASKKRRSHIDYRLSDELIRTVVKSLSRSSSRSKSKTRSKSQRKRKISTKRRTKK